MILQAVSLTGMDLLLTPNDRHLPKLHQDIFMFADIFILLIARDGSDFLAVFRNPRRVLLVFKDPLFPYCTCVIKDPIKSSDFLRFCPGLWRK